MLEDPQFMAKKPIPAAPHLRPTLPKFASVAGSCCFISIRIVNSKHIKDKCNCRSFIQQAKLEDQEFSSSWSSLDRYFCSCGHHAQYHPPKDSACDNTTECEMEGHHPKEEEEEVNMPYLRPLSPVPPQEAENNRHIWHLYQKTAKLEQEISQKPNPDDVKTSVDKLVGNLEERILELEDRLEDTEIRLEESERKARSLQDEVDELIDENEDLRQGLPEPQVERAATEELEKLWREESERRQEAEKNLHDALSALKPISKQNPWRVYVKLVLDPDQKAPAPYDSDEYVRCDTLGCYQYVSVEGCGSRNFQSALSLSLPSSLLMKRWMPLIASKGPEGQVELERAYDVEGFPSLWSVDFLRNTCALTIDGQDILYIAPHAGSLAIEDLESPRESPGLTEASTISSTSVLRRSNRKRSITNNTKVDTPVVMKRVRVKS
ncbi:hypothetical protein ABW19_dt0209141 [Dactylella cylindrospora]|nr:hypothetical protein ABW19_dt0209141 [Dactylella cylindrospora]